LIAGYFSFYNAGSGTNQSNHMYKLGPLHEGKLERGCKTGSFAYLMWPCRIGPFSVVLGKHKGSLDTADFPFSLLDAAPDGRCQIIPGLNLATVGTVRDGAKWPARDRRKGPLLRDRITWDVFSPLSVGRMIHGEEKLAELQETADKAAETVALGGARIKRVLLRTGVKFYRTGIQLYLLQELLARLEASFGERGASLRDALASAGDAEFSQPWVDVAGQLMPQSRLDVLIAKIENRQLGAVADVEAEFDRIETARQEDEWLWVKHNFRQVFDLDLDQATAGQLRHALESLKDLHGRYVSMILADAAKEFDESARTGFGLDGGPETALADFRAVRGDYNSNRFVRQMQEETEAISQRVDQVNRALAEAPHV
jgi:hypothetical protein